ncbi:MAG: type 1 periplasmic binding fold superfamily protein [Flavobacteriaceae bacterium]|nr:type 1 periplasmic binding fold superfamily protein [Flavobacteriaceae bacterium]|tara:strand:- start:2404 stop:2955 length:552 start_codon:yes stop_codon:yes gene_type:complete
MKINKFLPILLMLLVTVASCSKDDDPLPEAVNEEEVITTMEVTLTSGASVITLKTQDLDGDGPNAPVVTVSGNLAAGTTYDGVMKFLNELESPAENITEEVEEEDLDHQVFFTVGSGLDVTTEYSNNDSAGNPLGTQFKLTAGSASSGNLTFTLVHEPTKPNTGLASAGGETDIDATFSITIE